MRRPRNMAAAARRETAVRGTMGRVARCDDGKRTTAHGARPFLAEIDREINSRNKGFRGATTVRLTGDFGDAESTTSS